MGDYREQRPPLALYRSRHLAAAILLVALLLLIAIGGRSLASPIAGPTIQAVMDRVIDPSADALWASVGDVEDASGQHARAPRNDAEWRQAAAHARTLAAGARTLTQPHLEVGGLGSGLADASTPGIRTPRDIRADIDRDPPRFAAAADRLQAAARQALFASDRHDPTGLLLAGAQIDAACESCHSAYWYPRRRLNLPSADAFDGQALRP